jgi:DNA repair protein RecO (recombination protein O)
MAIQKTEAILLRKKDLRETSLALTFFTRNFGKIQGVLKGARGARARSDTNPLYFSLDQIVFYENKKRDFFIISQCETQRIFFSILKDWDRASVAYYILELTDVFTETGVKSEEIFKCLLSSLVALDSKKETSSVARFFEVKFLMALGLWPGAETFSLTKGAMSTLGHFEKDELEVASKIKLDSQVGIEIKKVTQKIILDNIDRPLKTTKIFTLQQC